MVGVETVAQATARSKIIAAARHVFVNPGYAAATIKQLADAADVSVQSVYFVFGNKPSVLSALLEVEVAGDEARISTLDRPWVAAALGAPHPLGQLRIQVHHGRLILERTADILLALRAAASADEDAALLWQTNLAQRRTVQQHLMIGLVEKDPSVDLETAINVALTLTSAETYTDLVVESGWTGEQYEEWVVGTLASTLGLDQAKKSRPRRM
ncbi:MULTISPECIES: TetR/AcrR family transcriptional regulator [Rhodococcus]|uniref:TetR/AcrR family transcriptional regulator n=1 Tax=Rhodococcus globerulus TaxID=33008 RepID=A0ABU4BTV5_RHOGO|nr:MULTISPECIES: TetR/AcrR family transcriptional regulator [Rhodococcus]MCE4264795.1 helix-turn-helix transcriptional regulator [Rhodococcus globerulus]MDV6267661.1 TetR/AcrR family transcriptional regulator [Rhodococcus globerulus]MDV8065658.1 TetR/AcrR family transcriptional regulator [Rhodococcus sp. IEGM 1366]